MNDNDHSCKYHDECKKNERQYMQKDSINEKLNERIKLRIQNITEGL